MTKKYKNSPLTEVVAEFNFIPDKQWNSTVPGELYTKIKVDFPIVKQREDQLLLALPIEEKPQERVQLDFVQLTQFWNEDNTLLVQIGKDFLTINALKPYPNWESFFPLILKIFNLYCEVASPKGIKRADLRYINTIQVSKEYLGFEGNFKLPMPIPPDLKYSTRFINTHMEYDINAVDVLSQKITSVPTLKSEEKNLVLQIEVVMNKFNGLLIENVSDWLNSNHQIIIETFESTLDNSLKAKFD
jgi:uncharacterized protein (TIGR04255 family)